MRHTIELIIFGSCCAAAIKPPELLAQAHPTDWTSIASLPFAFAVGAFLIWSMVQLVNAILSNQFKTYSETVQNLRVQVQELRQFQQSTMESLLGRSVSALEKDVEANSALVNSWSQLHSDLREVLTEIRLRPCLLTLDEDKRDGRLK